MGWLVAITQPQREAWGEKSVQREGCNTYLPKCLETVFKHGKAVTVVRYLFPRYLFVELEDDNAWGFLFRTYGVSGIVRAGDRPAPIPTEEIEKLKARENREGVIVLPPKPKVIPFKKGQALKVLYGPMSGIKCICQGDTGREKVRIVLQFLGAKRSIQVPRHIVAALPPPVAAAA